MALAVGVIETQGFPAVLAAADAMLKAGRVTLVTFEMAESARFLYQCGEQWQRSSKRWRQALRQGMKPMAVRYSLITLFPIPPTMW